MDFKIHYRDESTYSGPAEAAPILDVVLIVERNNEHGKKLVLGGDFYCYENGKWVAGDQWTMISYMARPGFEKRFLIGVMIPDFEEWNEFVKRAEEDPDFPPRTGYHRSERRR